MNHECSYRRRAYLNELNEHERERCDVEFFDRMRVVPQGE